MKKKLPIIATLLVAILVATFCVYKFFPTNYKDLPGYEAYISDRNAGYEQASYYCGYNAIEGYEDDEESSEARKYYKRNARRCGDYLITDYEDGICINRYYGTFNEIKIPEELAGKPVVKLGAYLETGKNVDIPDECEAVSAFSGIRDCTLYIPATVKYISSDTLWEYLGYINSEETIGDSPHISQIYVDEDNPYYYSENGNLFTKDKKTLLFLNKDISDYTVPDFVENFIPSDNIPESLRNLTLGKNIKFIDASILDSEGCDVSECYDKESYEEYCFDSDITVKGYKGTIAEEWAEKYYQEFVPLD